MGSLPTTRWIRTADQLAELVDGLAGCRAIGFDTEADSLHHYTEKVCLLQLTAFGGESWLLDPLALQDLTPLAPLFADATVLKVVHGGDNDVTSMRRDFGLVFRTMFDTAIDSVFAAITRALALPENELPAREPGERTQLSAAARRRVEALRSWRAAQATRSRLEPSIILPQRLIDRVAIAGPQTLAELAVVDGVRQWRVAEWGPALLAACA